MIEDPIQIERVIVPRLAPAEVAELIGVSADTQRDWRRRSLIDNLGKQDDSGRWRYSVTDTFTMWIARRLNEIGFDIADAMPLAYVVAGKLLASENTFLFGHDKDQLFGREDTPLVTRYMVLFLDNGEWQFLETNNLMNLFKHGWPLSFVVDLWNLAATAPKSLVHEAFPSVE